MARFRSRRELEILAGAGELPSAALDFEFDGRSNPLRRDMIVRCCGHFEFARDEIGEPGRLSVLTALTFGTCGDAIDIIAYRAKPNLLLSLLGRVTVVGEDQVLRPYLRRGLRVHRTLAGYLAHRRRGIVIMNRSRAALLLHGIRLIPEDTIIAVSFATRFSPDQ